MLDKGKQNIAFLKVNLSMRIKQHNFIALLST